MMKNDDLKLVRKDMRDCAKMLVNFTDRADVDFLLYNVKWALTILTNVEKLLEVQNNG